METNETKKKNNQYKSRGKRKSTPKPKQKQRPEGNENLNVNSGAVNLVPKAMNLFHTLGTTSYFASVQNYYDKSEDFSNALTNGYITKAIKSYAAERGYDSPTAIAQVNLVLERSFRAFSLLVSILKHQNALHVVDSRGREIYELLFDKYRSTDFRGKELNIGGTSKGANTSISNHSWEVDYVTGLKYMFLSPQMIEFALRRYGVWHVSESDTDNFSFIEFIPNGAFNGGNGMTDNYKAQVELLKDTLESSTYPDLIPIMNMLGFGSIEAESIDFSRVRTQDQLAIAHNPNIYTWIINSHPNPQIWNEGSLWSDTFKGRFYDLSSPFTILNIPEGMAISDQILIDSYFLETEAYGVVLLHASSGTLQSKIAPFMGNSQIRITANLTSTPSTSDYVDLIRFYGEYINENALSSVPGLPISIQYIWDFESNDWQIMSQSVTNTLNDGSVYQLSDPGLIKNMIKASLVFGGEYRRNLQLILASERQQKSINIK